MKRPRKKKYNPQKTIESLAHGFTIIAWDSENADNEGTKVARAYNKFGQSVNVTSFDRANRKPRDWLVTIKAQVLDSNGQPETHHTEMIARGIRLNDLHTVYVKEKQDLLSELKRGRYQIIDTGYVAKVIAA